MNVGDLQHQIDKRREWIKSLQEALPYADSAQARSGDLKLIRGYQNEIRSLEAKIEVCKRDLSNNL